MRVASRTDQPSVRPLSRARPRDSQTAAFAAPFVRQIDPLPALHHPHHLLWMSKDVLNFDREIIGISQLEKDQFLRTKIIQNSRGPWSNDRLSLRQVFKNARWRVELGEDASPIRNDADVTFANRLGNFFQLLRTKVSNGCRQLWVVRTESITCSRKGVLRP